MLGLNKIQYLQVGIIIVLLLAFLFPIFNLYIKSIMNVFAFGISNFKVYYVLFFLLLGTIMYQLPKKKCKYFDTLWISIIILFIMGLLFHLFIFSSNNLDSYQRTLFALDDEFSSTHLFHTHESKVIMGQFTRFFTEIKISYDSGIPFLQYINPFIIIIFTLGYLASLYFFFQSIRGIKKHVFLYIISGAVVYKNIIDGGIFNPENIVAFSIFSYLIWYQYNKNIIYYILICIAGYALWYGLYGSLNFLIILSFGALGYGIIYAFEEKKITLGILLLVLLIIVLFTNNTSFKPYFLDDIHYVIPPQTHVVIVSGHNIKETDTFIFYNVTKMGNYYWYEILTLKPTSKVTLSKQFKVNVHYNSISINNMNCNKNNSYTFSAKVYNANIHKLHDPILNISLHDNNQIMFELAGCTPSPERTVISFLFENGNRNVIVIP